MSSNSWATTITTLFPWIRPGIHTSAFRFSQIRTVTGILDHEEPKAKGCTLTFDEARCHRCKTACRSRTRLRRLRISARLRAFRPAPSLRMTLPLGAV